VKDPVCGMTVNPTSAAAFNCFRNWLSGSWVGMARVYQEEGKTAL